MKTLLHTYLYNSLKTAIEQYGTDVTLVFKDCRYVSGDKFTGEGYTEDCTVTSVDVKAVVYPYFSWSDKSVEFSNIANVVKNLDQTYILQVLYDESYDIAKLKEVNIQGVGECVVRGIRYHAIDLTPLDFVVLVEKEG